MLGATRRQSAGTDPARVFGVLYCSVRLCVRLAVGEVGGTSGVSVPFSLLSALWGLGASHAPPSPDLGLKWSPNMCWVFCKVCKPAKLDGSVEPFKSLPVD